MYTVISTTTFSTRITALGGLIQGTTVNAVPAPANGYTAGILLDVRGVAFTQPNQAGTQTVTRNESGVLFYQFEASPLQPNHALDSLTISATGTADDAQSYSSLTLWVDADQDSQFDPNNDTQVATGAFTQDDGDLMLNTNSFALGNQIIITFFLVGDMTGYAAPGQDLQFDLTAAVVSPAGTQTYGLPAGVGDLITVADGVLNVSYNGLNTLELVQTGSAGASGDGHVLYDLTLEAVDDDFDLDSITFTASGSGDDLSGYAALNLYQDDGNGVFDGAGTDAPIATSLGAFSAGDGTATFSLSGTTLSQGSTLRLFLCGSLSNSPTPNQTFQATLTNLTARAAALGSVATLPTDTSAGLEIDQPNNNGGGTGNGGGTENGGGTGNGGGNGNNGRCSISSSSSTSYAWLFLSLLTLSALAFRRREHA